MGDHRPAVVAPASTKFESHRQPRAPCSLTQTPPLSGSKARPLHIAVSVAPDLALRPGPGGKGIAKRAGVHTRVMRNSCPGQTACGSGLARITHLRVCKAGIAAIMPSTPAGCRRQARAGGSRMLGLRACLWAPAIDHLQITQRLAVERARATPGAVGCHARLPRTR